MRAIRVALLALFATAVGYAAGAACPYLNSETAGGVLGGTVQVTVTPGPSNSGDAVCEFKRESGTATLRIEVKTMTNWRTGFPTFLAQCGPHPDTLRGIGNEAQGCGAGKSSYQILSRVRGQSILVRVTSAELPERMREQARKIAEAVAGFLF